jgi:hypothetical protein
MSYTVKTNNAGGYLVAEYCCPWHGVFEATVQRDENGDAPDEQYCPEMTYMQGPFDASAPPDGWRGEIDGNGERWDYVYCQARSTWTASPTMGRVRLGEVHRGPNERPPNAMSLDTRKMGEGQSLAEFREERAKIRHEHRQSEIRDFKEGR